jgi:hypothetical protein
LPENNEVDDKIEKTNKMTTSTNATIPTTETPRYTLPPLILHPFADANGPGKLVESSRASLMLQGMLPNGDRDLSDLDKVLLDGRYQEIRMLFYLGRDLVRWMEQCMEFVSRHPELANSGIKEQSFAAHLIQQPPPDVEAKLKRWGVVDFRAIFARALGLNAIFRNIPAREELTNDFVRNYYPYADQMFQCRQSAATFLQIKDCGFHYELFASGEYSRMLEREWA